LSQKNFFVPILVFFGSQEAVKKFGPKIGFFLVWTSHPSGIPTVKLSPYNGEKKVILEAIF
jgi:hypothetical protein